MSQHTQASFHITYQSGEAGVLTNITIRYFSDSTPLGQGRLLPSKTSFLYLGIFTGFLEHFFQFSLPSVFTATTAAHQGAVSSHG